jgi:hypothetical protein
MLEMQVRVEIDVSNKAIELFCGAAGNESDEAT